jgi:hypothetical protein
MHLSHVELEFFSDFMSLIDLKSWLLLPVKDEERLLESFYNLIKYFYLNLVYSHLKKIISSQIFPEFLESHLVRDI